jgi:biotin carboxylase
MRKRLLIIGAGLEQVPAYKLAKGMGVNVVGTDMNPRAPALEYADDRLIASTRDVRRTVEAVLGYSAKKPIHGVMTVANDVPLTVASVAEKLRLPGIPVASANLASNKLLMKERFAKRGVPTPAFYPVRSKQSFFRLLREVRYPAILKPSDSRGSRGVLLLDGEIDLSWAWGYSLGYSEGNPLILEKFAEGPQLSVEGIFVNRGYMPIAFADRNYGNLALTKPHMIEDGGVIPTRFRGERLRAISVVIAQAASSLGISWGSVKADIVLTKEGPQILELAARLSGNYLATHHIPMAYGVDIVSALIRLSLGEEVRKSDVKARYRRYLGVRYFFPPPGKIVRIAGAGEVRRRPYVRMLQIYRKPGDYQEKITDHTKRAGTVICEGPSYSVAKERVERAVEKIRFYTKG